MCVALLSTAAVHGDAGDRGEQGQGAGLNAQISALPTILGISLLSLQIRQLHKMGVRQFLLEVEQITGALTALADDLQQQDIELSVIRSAQDMQGKLPGEGKMLVLAPGTSVDMDWLHKIMVQDEDVIITLPAQDGRHGQFEIIDLNSKWSGIAIADVKTFSSLDDLPDGWSLPSAMLREAVAKQTKFSQLSDDELGRCDLQQILSQNDANTKEKQLLAQACNHENGAVEAGIFAPLSAALLPYGHGAMVRAGLFAAGGAIFAIIAAYLGHMGIAAIIGLLVIFLVTIERQQGFVTGRVGDWRLRAFTWFALASSALIGGFQADGISGLFAAAMTAGLGYLVHQVTRAKRHFSPVHRYLLPSPGLLALLLLAGGMAQALTGAMQAAALLQLLYLAWHMHRR